MSLNSRRTMFHSFLFYCLLLFICNNCQFCSANQLYTTENTIRYIQEVYPKLCENNAASHGRNLTVAQSELLTILRNLSVDYHDPKVMISDKIVYQINDTKLKQNFNTLLEHMRNIQTYYDEFLDIFVNYHEYPPKSLQDFIDTTTSPSSVEFKALVDDLQEVFTDIWTHNNINHIDTGIGGPHPVCLENRSLQQLFNEFSRTVSIAHIKGLFVILHSYCMQEKIDNRSYAISKESAINKYKRNIKDNLARIKDVTENVSREVLRCDPSAFKNGETFSKLDSVFQAYFIYENRPLYKFFSGSACESLPETIQCTSDRCRNQPEEKRCGGNLRNCQSTDNNMKFCIANSKSDRRYDWMSTETGDVFGHYYTIECNDVRSVEGSRFTSDVCICNCESEDTHAARYFSLHNVTSDVGENKVVTGVRWLKKKSVFHIQIQQGILEAEGSIKNNSVEWKEIDFKWSLEDNSTVSLETMRDSPDVYAVTNDANTVYLDDFDSEKDKLITGLRLQRTGNDLRLEIRETPFNFTSGKLDGEASTWVVHSNTAKRRTEVKLTSPDEPIRMGIKSKIQVSHSNQFVRFTMTDAHKDLGQHTVPYIDLREVVTNPPMPLAGIGLFHKGHEGFGGFLAMKLMHYNFAYYA